MYAVAIIRNNEITNKAQIRKLFDLPDGKYLVKVSSCKTRSTNQNAYYWAVVVPLVYEGLRDLGYDLINHEQAHQVLKSLFLKEIIQSPIEKIEVVKSTTELSTEQFSEYIERVARFCSEDLGIVLPESN